MMRDLLWLVAAFCLATQWLIAHALGLHPSPALQALLSGLAIFGAAFLLSWATELAQLELPQSLALACLALIAVLPEYAVDLYFAWQAATRPEYTAYATANMTGANRLLIGLGWSAIVVGHWWKSGARTVQLNPRAQKAELRYLSLATLYAFVIPLKGTLSLLDTAILVGLFVSYLRATARGERVEPSLHGPAARLARWPRLWRGMASLALFAVAGAGIFTAAEPFAEGLLEVGKGLGIDKFLLIQWLAPLASESPEFLVALVFVFHGQPAVGLSTLVSSKVNQWTLLVGTLPLVFSLAKGAPGVMVLDGRQVQEILLTAAQSAFAVAVLANFSLSLRAAGLLASLFLTQLLFQEGWIRYGYSALYLCLTPLVLRTRPGGWRNLVGLPLTPRKAKEGT